MAQPPTTSLTEWAPAATRSEAVAMAATSVSPKLRIQRAAVRRSPSTAARARPRAGDGRGEGRVTGRERGEVVVLPVVRPLTAQSAALAVHPRSGSTAADSMLDELGRPLGQPDGLRLDEERHEGARVRVRDAPRAQVALEEEHRQLDDGRRPRRRVAPRVGPPLRRMGHVGAEGAPVLRQRERGQESAPAHRDGGNLAAPRAEGPTRPVARLTGARRRAREQRRGDAAGAEQGVKRPRPRDLSP